MIGVNRAKICADLMGYLLIDFEARLHKDEVRASALGGDRRQGRADAEAARLVARSRHHAPRARAADRNGLAAQVFIVALLDGGVERVHIDVNDLARRSFGIGAALRPHGRRASFGFHNPRDLSCLHPGLCPRSRIKRREPGVSRTRAKSTKGAPSRERARIAARALATRHSLFSAAAPKLLTMAQIKRLFQSVSIHARPSSVGSNDMAFSYLALALALALSLNATNRFVRAGGTCLRQLLSSCSSCRSSWPISTARSGPCRRPHHSWTRISP